VLVYQAGVTIILTTHYLEEAESLCRNIAIIDEGRIIENDSMANVVGKLQREAFVLTLAERLSEAPVLDGYTVRLRNEHEIELEVTKGQGLNAAFAALTAQSLHVASMRTKTNRLEELFLRLVENGPADAQGARPATAEAQPEEKRA
jgi:ABC-2 type transport system ATP-binding protein